MPTNFFFAGAGTGGGLYNAYSGTYANNVAPDLIVKGAWDMPKAHIELGGLARFLRDFYYPITGAGAVGAARLIHLLAELHRQHQGRGRHLR